MATSDNELHMDGLLLEEGQFDTLDVREYDRYREASADTSEIYEALSVSDRKAEILDDLHHGRDADFSVQDLDVERTKRSIGTLKALKRELIEDGSLPADALQAYRWKINEDIAGLEMLKASNAGDSRSFNRFNEFIYGKPDPVIYGAALDWIAHDAEGFIADDKRPDVVKDAARMVLDNVSGLRGYRELLKPEPEVFEAVRADHMRKDIGFFGLLLAGVELPTPKVSKEKGDPILEHILHDNLHTDFELADAESTTWSVSGPQGIVRRPKQYNFVTNRWMGLAAGHEVGSHLVEFLNGQRGPLGLASSGLDRYEAGNEGRAVIREQVPYESFDEFGNIVRWRDIMRRHIAISYAYGVGEDAPHSSHEVYDFIKAIDYMYAARLSPNDLTEADKKATEKTDPLILRVLKGTDGKGGAYLKDKVYLEGNVACWLAASLDGSRVISQGDLGKFDINNPRHITVLQNVGLLPKQE